MTGNEVAGPARRGGSGNPPHVRLHDGDVVEVYWQGGWEQAVVEDLRTLTIEFEPQFLLAVTERTDREDGVDHEGTDPETGGPCGNHGCSDGPDFCDGYICFSCRWVCPNSPEDPPTYGVPF
jgi:hypothetical protein